MIRAAIVEDDEIYRDKLKSYLARYGREKGMEFQISLFSDGDEITENYKAVYDIVFMDIKMRFMDGMSAAEEIRKTDEQVSLIFITNLPQYAIQGYRVLAADYLVKPISYELFSDAMTRALARRKHKEACLTVTVRNGIRRLAISQIRYVEVLDHDLIFHLTTETFTAKGTMREMEESLSADTFFKVNKSFLINLQYVDAVQGSDVVLGEDCLQVSRSRKKRLMDALNDYMERTGL